MSSCDIIVTALQQTGRAKVVGAPPAGAGYWVEQSNLPLGYWINLARDIEALGPDHQPIESHPAKVDYPVSPTVADVTAGRDLVFDKAIELLTN